MKKIFQYTIFLLSAVFATVPAWGSIAEQKHTLVYAVDGCDSLRLDHYVAAVEGKRPCVMFLFGGGFVGGVRDKQNDIPYF
ncbi:MAG: alpha/beta hydrolase, partial [Alistipes sp.]|nr:alpha/beta hydrolase [Alistipes sp.]